MGTWDCAEVTTQPNGLSLEKAFQGCADLPAIRLAHGRVGACNLICELASGGMGTVYVARREHSGGLQRTVAVKTIRPQLAAQFEFARMFLAEARAQSNINHPYVCKLLDLGMAHGIPYVEMEYLVGEPLSRAMPLLLQNQSNMMVAWSLRAVASLCEGLHAAHEAYDHNGVPMRLIHRDISPQNLFVLYDGTVRLVDFGVAKVSGPSHTRVGAVKGKVAYMSPEQVRCEPLDRRSDIWSMGVVLWEMLTGRALFSHTSSVESAFGIERGDIAPPSCHNPFVPRSLDSVVMRALQRDKSRRYPDAESFAYALERLISEHFGYIPRLMLGDRLDLMFPGSRSFRKRIVAHSQMMMLHQSGQVPIPTEPFDDAECATRVAKPVVGSKMDASAGNEPLGWRRAFSWFRKG